MQEGGCDASSTEAEPRQSRGRTEAERSSGGGLFALTAACTNALSSVDHSTRFASSTRVTERVVLNAMR